MKYFPPEGDDEEDDDRIQVAIIGKPNVGVLISVRNTITSAWLMAISACSRIKVSISLSVLGSKRTVLPVDQTRPCLGRKLNR